jgi:hypothetical protein
MPLAVSKDVQDELAAIRADLQTAMLKFIRDKHYGAAERLLVIVDRSLNNLIRDAAVMGQGDEETKLRGIMVVARSSALTPAPSCSPLMRAHAGRAEFDDHQGACNNGPK